MSDDNQPPGSTPQRRTAATPTFDLILLGGGQSERFRADAPEASVPKQFQRLGDAPVFIHALRAFLSIGCFRQAIFAVPEAHEPVAQELIEEYLGDERRTLLRVVHGGTRRQDSSRIALEAAAELSPAPTRVVIHDACRPFLGPEFRERIREKLYDRSFGAWIPTIPVVDTLKRVESGQVVETVDRAVLQRVQTPQIFDFELIRGLAERAQRESPDRTFTDDASLCEDFGTPVGTFLGDPRNIKLTYRFELDTLRLFFPEPVAPMGDNSPKAPN
jgi:2-C-methyl-D-erythritol 4-phosphate cytidylyltransferase/2-C-methyl-D-erythritol 2,4-cyclodiphosphate synthase